jgi:hypothetical protein
MYKVYLILERYILPFREKTPVTLEQKANILQIAA